MEESAVIPSAPFALLVFLALVPGWLYFRLAERRGPRPERSQLVELLELAAVGVTAVIIAGTSVIALSLQCHWLFNIIVWARVRHYYLGDHFAAIVASVAAVIGLSCLVVVGMFLIFYGRKAPSFLPGANVWDQCLGPAPEGKQNWLGIHRADGSLIEGLLLSYPSGAGEGARELALTRPIYITPEGGRRSILTIDRVVIPGQHIVAITVVHVPKPSSVRHTAPALCSETSPAGERASSAGPA
jgi:hypothetical protein